jgi:hypothetical protein
MCKLACRLQHSALQPPLLTCPLHLPLQATLLHAGSHAQALSAWQERCTAQLAAAYQELAAAASAAADGEAQVHAACCLRTALLDLQCCHCWRAAGRRRGGPEAWQLC